MLPCQKLNTSTSRNIPRVPVKYSKQQGIHNQISRITTQRAPECSKYRGLRIGSTHKESPAQPKYTLRKTSPKTLDYQFGAYDSHSDPHSHNSNLFGSEDKDLSKVSDAVDHKSLFDKLKNYGIAGTPYNWFETIFLIANNMYKSTHITHLFLTFSFAEDFSVTGATN